MATKTALPIFEKPGSSKPKQVRTVKVCGASVPITEAEAEALKTRLKAHQDAHGASFGFFAQLLDLAPPVPAPSTVNGVPITRAPSGNVSS